MKNLPIILGGIALLVAVGALLLGFSNSAKSTVATQSFGATNNAITEPAGTLLPNGTVLPNPSTSDYVVSRVYDAIQGALGIGDGTSVPIHEQAERELLTAATTTPCSLQNPFTATSSVSIQGNITVGTSTAGTLTVATSTNAFATTSLVATFGVGASNMYSFSVDGPSATANTIVGPSQWVVMGVSGVSYGFTYGGSCSAEFQTLI